MRRKQTDSAPNSDSGESRNGYQDGISDNGAPTYSISLKRRNSSFIGVSALLFCKRRE